MNLIYLGILFYFFLVMGLDTSLSDLIKGSLLVYIVIWVAGILWYFYWKARNKKVGVDTNMTFGELPPD